MKKHFRLWRFAYLGISQILLCWIPIFEPFLGWEFGYLPMRYRFDWFNFIFAVPAAINFILLFYYGFKDYEGKN